MIINIKYFLSMLFDICNIMYVIYVFNVYVYIESVNCFICEILLSESSSLILI
jgi:hypothetical protein